MNEFIKHHKITYELIYIINFIYNLGDDNYLLLFENLSNNHNILSFKTKVLSKSLN